jgi:hypothetical protein
VGDHERRGEVGPQHRLERVERLLPHERAGHDASRVHEQVDAAHLGDDPREGLGVGAVSGRPSSADVVGGRLEAVGRARREDHVVAARYEHAAHGQPDPAAASGDDRYPRAPIHAARR